MSDDRKQLVVSGGVPLVILAAGWVIFVGPARPTGESLAAAIVTFAGAVLTAAVALVGHIFKRQTDKRLERGSQEKRERLRLDAAMRAGELLAAEGTQTTPAVVASGLLALTNLGQELLAVTLLVDLWKEHNSQVSSETAVLVIDKALRSDEHTVQLVGAELLCRNAERLDPCQSLHWPSALEGTWNPRFSRRTKLLIVEALVTMTLAAPATEGAIRAVAVRLYAFWEAEQECARTRGCIGKLLSALQTRLDHLGYNDFLQGDREVRLTQLDAAAASAHTGPDGFLDQLADKLADRLAAWSADCEGLPASAGSLSTAECGIPHTHPQKPSARRNLESNSRAG
ncbi:hypothetical protein JMUB6875_55120 [Nocardia sp. JMUB6875]|uniref:hypothetical protein n=1 Tax=Nocardia sp. JMUB6875 TaxID=3158170 RepID=UPI0032E5BF18